MGWFLLWVGIAFLASQRSFYDAAVCWHRGSLMRRTLGNSSFTMVGGKSYIKLDYRLIDL